MLGSKIQNFKEMVGLVNKKENREDIRDVHTSCQNRVDWKK